MGAFYGTKIKDKEINPKTKGLWRLEDVPSLWKNKTKQWLEDN